MDISLHLHDPDELKAFARFCNDMADVRVKQRDRPESPAEPLVRAFEQARDFSAVGAASARSLTSDILKASDLLPNPGPLTAYERAEVDLLTKGCAVLSVSSEGVKHCADPLLPPPHDSLEEAQRAAAVNASMLHTPLPPVPAPAPVGFDTQALADDAAKLFGLGVNPMTGQPVGATSPAVPLPPPVAAPSTAAVDQFLTAPAAPPAGQVLAFPLPVPQSAPSVAAPTAAGTTSPAGGVDLDADGLPWDHRIHSSSKEKNKDGRWRAKRNLNDEGLVKRIEAELRATMAIPAPLPAVPSVSQPPSAPVVAPPTAIPLPPAAATDPTDFASLIAVLTPRLTPDRMPKIFEIVQSFGLPGLPALQQRPDLVPAVWAKLKEHLG